MQHQAHHDALTGLPTRTLFEDRLHQALLQARRHGHAVAVMFLDLDGFKGVNDTLGHDAGDELLVQVARRLQTCVRESDTLVRLGGDEFMVIASHLGTAQDAAVVAQRLLAALEAPFEISGQTVRIGTSLGVSLYPQDGQDSVTLQKHADIAMYQVKHGGRSGARFYSSPLAVWGASET